jgi:hypothetical protein
MQAGLPWQVPCANEAKPFAVISGSKRPSAVGPRELKSAV